MTILKRSFDAASIPAIGEVWRSYASTCGKFNASVIRFIQVNINYLGLFLIVNLNALFWRNSEVIFHKMPF